MNIQLPPEILSSDEMRSFLENLPSNSVPVVLPQFLQDILNKAFQQKKKVSEFDKALYEKLYETLQSRSFFRNAKEEYFGVSPCNIPYCPCDVNYMRKTYSSYDERKPDFIYSKELQIVKDSNNFCFVKEVNSRGEVLCKVIVKVSCDGTFQMLPFKTIPAHDGITLKDENSIIYVMILIYLAIHIMLICEYIC